LNSQTNRRSGNRLPSTGAATAGIPCCSTRNCSGSKHHHVGSSSGRSDLLISSARRRNCPGNRPTAQPSPKGRRGSRQSPGGNRSPKHSWFYQTAPGTASPLSINPSQARTPVVKVLLTSKKRRLQREGRQSPRQGVEMKSDWRFDKPRSYYWLRVAASNLASQSPCLAGVTQSHCNPK